MPSTAVALGHIRPYRETSERLRGFENLSESLMGWGGVPGGGLKFVETIPLSRKPGDWRSAKL